VAAAVALYAWLPRGIPAPRASLLQEARSLGRTQVLLAMLISVLASASLFSVFTYIAPILENVTRESPHQVTWALVVFGAGLTVGNLIGGRLGDWRLMPSVIVIFILLIGVLSGFTITDRVPWLALPTLFVWGSLTFALVSPLQMRVMNAASDAPNLASTLNQGAFNLGNASGAFAGGVALTHGFSYDSIPWIGAALAAAGLLFSALSHALDHGRIELPRKSVGSRVSGEMA
jgi:MFS transporter, DHA1 family, inner membrane transport protein